MSELLSGYELATIPYLDDISFKSESHDQHVEHVKCFFENIRTVSQ